MRQRALSKEGKITYIEDATHGDIYYDDMFPDLEMIPVQGSIKVWHYRYKSGQDRDTWADNENSMCEWHINQQCLFSREEREVPIPPHRADVLTGSGDNKVAIEFQHSWLSANVIAERSDFYIEHVGAVIWVIDGSDIADEAASFRQDKGHLGFTRYYLCKKSFIGGFKTRPNQELFIYRNVDGEDRYIHVYEIRGNWECFYGNELERVHFLNYVSLVAQRVPVIISRWNEVELKAQAALEGIKKEEELAQERAHKAEEEAKQKAKELHDRIEKEKEAKIDYELDKFLLEINELRNETRERISAESTRFTARLYKFCNDPYVFCKAMLDRYLKETIHE